MLLVTPHVAGAHATEVHRLVGTALDDLERYASGQPPRNVVTAADLPRIA